MNNIKILLFWLFLANSANAAPYIEFGVGSTFGKCDCTRLDNPVGIVSVGYEFKNGLNLDVEHRSSMVRKDYGSNVISIRYRYTFK